MAIIILQYTIIIRALTKTGVLLTTFQKGKHKRVSQLQIKSGCHLMFPCNNSPFSWGSSTPHFEIKVTLANLTHLGFSQDANPNTLICAPSNEDHLSAKVCDAPFCNQSLVYLWGNLFSQAAESFNLELTPLARVLYAPFTNQRKQMQRLIKTSI